MSFCYRYIYIYTYSTWLLFSKLFCFAFPFVRGGNQQRIIKISFITLDSSDTHCRMYIYICIPRSSALVVSSPIWGKMTKYTPLYTATVSMLTIYSYKCRGSLLCMFGKRRTLSKSSTRTLKSFLVWNKKRIRERIPSRIWCVNTLSLSLYWRTCII